jgi:succinate dehydrogenase/fumarate reductase cytochrome b subunit
MTTQPAPAPHTAVAAATDGVPSRWQRFLALSGVAFAVPFLIGWFASAGVTPHYTASDQEWTNWAHDSKWHGRISGFAMLVAAFFFLHYLGVIRSVLGKAESAVSGSAQLARVVFAGALTGIAGMSMALVVMEAASSEGGNANPVVSRAVTAGAAGPYLIAAMGFAAFLMAGGVLTLRPESSQDGRGSWRSWARSLSSLRSWQSSTGRPTAALRLRVLSRRRGAGDVDDRDECRHLPRSGGERPRRGRLATDPCGGREHRGDRCSARRSLRLPQSLPQASLR